MKKLIDSSEIQGGITFETFLSLMVTKDKNKKETGTGDGPIGTMIIITNKLSEYDTQLMWVDKEYSRDFVLDAFNFETRHPNSIDYERHSVEFKEEYRFHIKDSLFTSGIHKDLVECLREKGKQGLIDYLVQEHRYDPEEDIDHIKDTISEAEHCSRLNRINPNDPDWYLEEIANDYTYSFFSCPEEAYKRCVKDLKGVMLNRYDWAQCGILGTRCHFLFFPSGEINLEEIVNYYPGI